jgi:hypothetical protein
LTLDCDVGCEGAGEGAAYEGESGGFEKHGFLFW